MNVFVFAPSHDHKLSWNTPYSSISSAILLYYAVILHSMRGRKKTMIGAHDLLPYEKARKPYVLLQTMPLYKELLDLEKQNAL